METVLNVGDRVSVRSGISPTLTFTVTEIVTEAGQLMVCGEYGCFAVELLGKIEPALATETGDLAK